MLMAGKIASAQTLLSWLCTAPQPEAKTVKLFWQSAESYAFSSRALFTFGQLQLLGTDRINEFAETCNSGEDVLKLFLSIPTMVDDGGQWWIMVDNSGFGVNGAMEQPDDWVPRASRVK